MALHIDKLGYDIIRDDVVIALDQYHIRKGTHLFFNYDFTRGTKCFIHEQRENYRRNPEEICENHRVHIFLSRENPSLFNGAMVNFIRNAIMVKRVKVIIHIPKHKPALRDLVESIVHDIQNVYVIFEKPSQIWFFWKSARYATRRFKVVQWNHDFISIGCGYADLGDKVTMVYESKTL